MTVAVKTRDPKVQTRNTTNPPKKAKQRKSRSYIAASMPTICPDCGHSTRMADGRHVDPIRETILEYRTCSKCHKLLAAGRPMTECERQAYCSRKDAIQEYEDSIRDSDC